MMEPVRPLVFAAAVCFLGSACSRSEDAPLEGDGGKVAVPSLPLAVPPLMAPSPADAPANAAVKLARDAGGDEARAQATDAGRLCGEKGLADCPLQLWMKRNATPAIRDGDTTALADVFDRIALLGPAADVAPAAAYPYWSSIARDGASASRMGDVGAAKAACRGCHTQYRTKYHGELRGLALPPPAGRQP